jgi:hypothetical protein
MGRLTQARVAKNKIYNESFTVQFINETNKSCEAKYEFQGKLQYDTEMKVDFRPPFLAKKSTPYSLKVEFQHQHVGRLYEHFYDSDKLPILDYHIIPLGGKRAPRFPCINKLFHKVY